MLEKEELRLAVLIDADNISHSYIKGIVEEIAKYGIPTIKRIYADWTKDTSSGWKKVLLENAIQPIQQYSYTTGKNSTDSAMIIDAMDILYSNKVDGFYIISSDSDFTRLATRLREAGMKVFGIGEKKTPSPFIAACDRFTYVEILNQHVKSSDSSENKKDDKESKNANLHIEDDIKLLLETSINDVADENGWAFLADVGNLITKKKPDFDSRNYGFAKLTPMIKKMKEFEIDERESGNSRVKHVYVRVKSS